MPSSSENETITIALLGNPNTGKSTLFNALAGLRQRVGNYPGVTVEKKTGWIDIDGQRFTLVDLPGTYSLSPHSPDEMVAVDVLLGRRDDMVQPNAVICIVDASNLERNLYLVSQVLELGLPVVVALNMMDVVVDKGLELDVEQLQKRLDVTVIPMQANRKQGLLEIKKALQQIQNADRTAPLSPFPAAFQKEVVALDGLIEEKTGRRLPRYLVERILLDTDGYLEYTLVPKGSSDAADPDETERNGEIHAEIEASRSRLAEAGCPVPGVEAIARYGWVGEILDGVVKRPRQRRVTMSDRLDRILTHKVWGTLLFVVLMVLVFQAVFSWAVPLMDLIDAGVGYVADVAGSLLPGGALKSLVVNGVISGVGAVLIFLPQIFILFLFIGAMEDCGYMSRAAFLMDKLMSRVGLNGKSFIPLLSSFACAIPGIMAARVIENSRDRLTTILIAPLMSCSARLPVYVLLIAAFIPSERVLGGWLSLQGITMFAMYSIGVFAAIAVALVLKSTVLKGPVPPFVMELPAYKIPSVRLVLWRMWDRGWAFVRRAGTLIFAVTVVVWAAGYFPHSPQVAQEIEQRYADEFGKTELAALETEIENEISSAYLKQSILGRTGQYIEPVVRPLGWDWRIGCAAIASFPAREVVIGTMGVIYNLGDEQDETSGSLRDKLRAAKWDDDPTRPVFNVPVALSIMVFFALCAQCASTLVVMRRETGGWRWPVFTFVYMTTLAYLGAFATYQIGMWLTS